VERVRLDKETVTEQPRSRGGPQGADRARGRRRRLPEHGWRRGPPGDRDAHRARRRAAQVAQQHCTPPPPPSGWGGGVVCVVPRPSAVPLGGAHDPRSPHGEQQAARASVRRRRHGCAGRSMSRRRQEADGLPSPCRRRRSSSPRSGCRSHRDRARRRRPRQEARRRRAGEHPRAARHRARRHRAARRARRGAEQRPGRDAAGRQPVDPVVRGADRRHQAARRARARQSSAQAHGVRGARRLGRPHARAPRGCEAEGDVVGRRPRRVPADHRGTAGAPDGDSRRRRPEARPERAPDRPGGPGGGASRSLRPHAGARDPTQPDGWGVRAARRGLPHAQPPRRSTSPYLLQHKDNPVDWWEWSPEAFAEAGAPRACRCCCRSATPPATGATSWRTSRSRTTRRRRT
jgi:hypothetical protein